VVSSSRFVGNSQSGLIVFADGTTATAEVSRSEATDNSSMGFYAYATSGSAAKLNVKDSVASGNVVTHNDMGLRQSGTAEMVSTGDNTVSDNTTATAGTIASLGKM